MDSGELIAILGAGITGRALCAFLERSNRKYILFDEKSHNQDFLKSRNYSEVIYSPGFSLDHPWIQYAKSLKIPCLGDIDFMLKNYRGKIIAITGTNGKTTITEFLAYALRNLGINAIACGNNEQAVGNLNDDELNQSEVLVLEISSYQAEVLKHIKIDYIIFTNIAEDHLDRHKNLDNYFDAKWNLVNCLKKEGILITTNEIIHNAQRLQKTLPKYEVIDSDYKDTKETAFDKYPFNINYNFIKKYFQIEGYNEEDLSKIAKTYKLPEYRLGFLGQINNVKFWNDSKSTNFSSVESALKNFNDDVYWIGGGQPKGGDLDNFLKKIAPSIKKAYLYGFNGEKIANLIEAPSIYYEKMEDAVRLAYNEALNEDKTINILFSPGFASFDQYKNYKERGEAFNKVFTEIQDNRLCDRLYASS